MKAQRFGLVCAVVAATVGINSPVSSETLTEALTQAYQYNPRLMAQRARLRSVDEQVPQALSGWRPSLTASGNAGYRHIDQQEDKAIDASDNLFNRRVNATIEQPLFRGGRTMAATRSAENSVRAERARLWSAEQNILLSATTAYVDVVAAAAVVELQIRNEQRLGRQLEATRDRFRVGEVTKTDVFQSEARLARATAERIRAEGALEAQRAVYKNVVGVLPGAVTKPPVPTPLPPSREAAIAGALGGNPDILAAEFDERASMDDIDLVRGELLPSVSLVGEAEREWEAAREGSRFDTLEASVRMTVPLYQAGGTYARLRAAKQTAAERRRLMDQARRNAEEAASQGFTNLQTARAATKSFVKQVQANEVALEGVKREADVGARTVLDILDAEQELVDSQVRLVQAEREEVVASYELTAATGALTADKLQLPVEQYDPEAHYREVRGRWFGGTSSGDVSSDFRKP